LVKEEEKIQSQLFYNFSKWFIHQISDGLPKIIIDSYDKVSDVGLEKRLDDKKYETRDAR